MTYENSVGVVEAQSFTFAEDEPFCLESGASLSPVTIAYETYGRLNADRSNAILVAHALSGSAHAAGYHSATDTKPGWWDDCIGPGKSMRLDCRRTPHDTCESPRPNPHLDWCR